MTTLRKKNYVRKNSRTAPPYPWGLGSNGTKCGAPHFVPNPERSKIRSRVGERALGRDLMRVLLRIITAYGERRPAELLLRFGRQGPVFIPDRTLTLLLGRQ